MEVLPHRLSELISAAASAAPLRDTPSVQRRDPPLGAAVHIPFIDVTGLIYVAIVALWAAVLIPMWLRRHDDDQAKRIERHRVAMGTLARIAHDPEAAHGLAARRRRVIVAATATLGALGTAAWIAGLLPGLGTAALWIPFLGYLPAAVLSERRASRIAAQRALEDRRERREARSNDHVAAAEVRIEPIDIDHVAADHVGRAPRPTVTWDEVFDQTA
ncbi:MAG: hypothetical protein RLZZ228_670 [Actinomycetota bacterium]|jgi:membrane protein implicated in regulation of membrane protease activity